ncbi:MAG TPA: M15 family metallopeptidase [Patescibacteria group bacterium]|nr:M15 family metallopeptidase [Patescibacteria group bacterium]
MAEPTKILPGDLVDLGGFVGRHPLKVDVVYAQPGHPDNIFKTGIYRPDAKMWCHRQLAPIILRAADICFEKSGFIFELKDCLRTVEAQALMADTEIVKANPHWLQEPNRLLSPPGKGGHPRGMAIDIILLTENGEEVDMGTRFDHLTSDPANNPAARSYKNFPPAVLAHRQLLEDAMVQAATEQGREILPLPQEWWDFRFMPAYANGFEPVSDKTLPPDMQVTAV